jgi:hypothetical protein
MISLDEDFLGCATDAILIRALKVCGGLLCVLDNNRLVGAHFTNITTPAEIYTACQYLHNHMFVGGNVAQMYFIYNMSAWGHRMDKYATASTLIGELKTMMHYTGVCRVYDKDIIADSVDVKLALVGTNVQISYRQTPNPDPAVNTPDNNVKRVKSQHGSSTPGVLDMNNVYTHKLPTNTGGFTLFVDSLFAQVK